MSPQELLQQGRARFPVRPRHVMRVEEHVVASQRIREVYGRQWRGGRFAVSADPSRADFRGGDRQGGA